jgi:hypothetical protein
MNRESLYTLHPLQIYETAERHAGGTGGKTEDLGSLVTVERLECSPPPNDYWVRAGVAIVFCRRAPFIYVNVWRAGNKELELLFVELRRTVSVWSTGMKYHSRS